jgi:hypothetical protein
MTVPPALRSHESTEHYTPQYILNAVITCVGAIDPDPASTRREILKRAGSEALYISGQRACAALGQEGLPQSTVYPRCRAMLFKVIPGAALRPDHRGDCVREVGDGNRCMEDADGDIVPGVFSFCTYQVCRALW